MIDWMITASIEICEDLIDSAILKIWAKSREGIMIHLQNDTVTPTSRFRSKELFQEAGREMQQVAFFSLFFSLISLSLFDLFPLYEEKNNFS